MGEVAERMPALADLDPHRAQAGAREEVLDLHPLGGGAVVEHPARRQPGAVEEMEPDIDQRRPAGLAADGGVAGDLPGEGRRLGAGAGLGAQRREAAHRQERRCRHHLEALGARRAPGELGVALAAALEMPVVELVGARAQGDGPLVLATLPAVDAMHAWPFAHRLAIDEDEGAVIGDGGEEVLAGLGRLDAAMVVGEVGDAHAVPVDAVEDVRHQARSQHLAGAAAPGLLELRPAVEARPGAVPGLQHQPGLGIEGRRRARAALGPEVDQVGGGGERASKSTSTGALGPTTAAGRRPGRPRRW